MEAHKALCADKLAFAQMRFSSIIKCASLFPSLFDSFLSLCSREIFRGLV